MARQAALVRRAAVKSVCAENAGVVQHVQKIFIIVAAKAIAVERAGADCAVGVARLARQCGVVSVIFGRTRITGAVMEVEEVLGIVAVNAIIN